MRTRGFTLIEMMLVVGIIGILATLAISTSKQWRFRQGQRELVRTAFSALNAARGHALKFGVNAKVHFDDDNETIIAFVEPKATADCLYTGAGGESVIYRYPETGSTLWIANDEGEYDSDIRSITLADPMGCNGQHTVVFDHRGFSVSRDGEPRSPTLTISDSVTAETLYIDVSVAGALRVR